MLHQIFLETLGTVQTRLSALNSSLKMLPMPWTVPALQAPRHPDHGLTRSWLSTAAGSGATGN